MGKKYVKKYEINTVDFDENRRLRAITIINFLQDISTRHYWAALTETGVEDADGFWVIVEWDVKVHFYPERAQVVTVTTEPIYFRKFIAYRKYDIVDASGNCVATAMSKWAYMRLSLHKQANIPSEIYDVFGVEPDAEKPPKLQRMQQPDIEPIVRHHHVGYNDIDVNGHVNNGAYFHWLMNAIPDTLSEARQPEGIQIHYRQEVFKGADVSLSMYVGAGAENENGNALLADICESEHVAVQCALFW
jgi:acyl-ACP thioesterase